MSSGVAGIASQQPVVAEMSHLGPYRNHLWVVLSTALFLWFHSLWTPYFLDTFSYLSWVRSYLETGTFPGSFRLMNVYTYVLPYRAFGEVGLKLITVALASLFAGFYYELVRRDFCPPVAVGACLLCLTAPASLITISHLKEDFNALAFLALAFVLAASSSPKRAAAAGAAYGVSILYKEFAVIYAPFLVVYLHAKSRGEEGWLAVKSLKRTVSLVSLSVVSALAAIAVLAPHRYQDFLWLSSSHYTGQFLGFFSEQQTIGNQMWEEAVLYLSPWYFLALVPAAAAFKHNEGMAPIYLAAALTSYGILSNTTVVHARHYGPVLFFLCPLVVEGARLCLTFLGSKFRQLEPAALSLGLAAVLALLQLLYLRPTLTYRISFNPQLHFYGGLAERLPEKAVLVGGDNGPIAHYYSRAPVIRAPVDAGDRDYEQFASELKERLESGHSVFVLPDYLAYDGTGTIRRRLPEEFVLNPFYTALGEDYHAMTYGHAVSHLLESFAEQQRCHYLRGEKESLSRDTGVDFELSRYHFNCGGKPVSFQMIEFQGHQTFLRHQTVWSLSQGPPL